jgi:catecholate siderophore receptor
MAANYQKFYQNVYPANGPLSGAVNAADTAFNLGAYQHTTNRDNVFNQTDFTYKGWTGPIAHTVGFGTEFGRQTGVDIRNTGIFPNGTNTVVQNPFAPTYFGPVRRATGSDPFWRERLRCLRMSFALFILNDG